LDFSKRRVTKWEAMNKQPIKPLLPYTKFQNLMRAYRRGFTSWGEAAGGATGGSKLAIAVGAICVREQSGRAQRHAAN
jgi:hypothetical protein